MMHETMRRKKIMQVSIQRITQMTVLILILTLGLVITPVSYAENHIDNSSKSIYGPVKGSDTLGQIVSHNYPKSNLSQQQIMIGILRSNPDAFIGGNIHFLLRGATLLLPNEKLIATIDRTEAINTIKKHYRYFQKGQTGNFKILPLENLNSTADKAKIEENTDIVASPSDKKKTKVDEIERLIQSRQQLTKSTKATTKENKKAVQTTAINATSTKKVTTNSSIKNIELESLKIKVSQLEKILSRRGLSTTSSSGTTEKFTQELQNTLKTQKQKIDQLELEKKSKSAELKQLQKKISELELSLEKMSQTLTKKGQSGSSNKDAVISQLRKENTKLQQKLSSLQLALDKKTQEVESLNIDIINSKKKIEKLENKLLNTDKENALLDKQIAAMEKKLERIRQTPNSNSSVTTQGNSSSIPPWTWLLPALFLLSILGYLFKRSFSQAERVAVSESIPPIRQAQNDKPPLHAVVKNNHKKSTTTVQDVPDIIASASEEESIEASIKLDIAKAYMDMDMSDEAIEILHEIPEEGSKKQCLEAKNLLDKLSS